MNEEPIIFITKPEKQLKEKDNLEIEINNYDNSHLYYKGFDLGTFKEIANLQQENKKQKEVIDKAIEFTNKNWGTWCTHHLEYMTELQDILQGSDSNE